ncbi:MAG: hypothetical protein AB1640_09850 [bacterium]
MRNPAKGGLRPPPHCAALCFACLILLGSELAAEPYLAVREGLKCSYCHVNKTGGGKRTAVFNGLAQTYLKFPETLFRDLEERTSILTGTLADAVRIGADLRVTNTTTFRDTPDSSGRVENNTLFRPADTNDFDVDEGAVYLEVDLIKQALVLYADESFAPGSAVNREAMGLLSGFLPLGGYLKGGKFYLPYGLRLQDDEAFIRSRTGFTFSTSDVGAEGGLIWKGLLVSAAVTDGTDDGGQGLDKQYTASGTYLFTGVPLLRSVMLGASFSRNTAVNRTLFGFYGAWNLWRLTVLAESDFIHELTSDRGKVDRRVVYTEANLLTWDWLNLKFAFDWFDPDADVNDDTSNRFSLGLEAFLARFLQARLFYRVANGIPQRPSDNYDQLMVEMHVFF